MIFKLILVFQVFTNSVFTGTTAYTNTNAGIEQTPLITITTLHTNTIGESPINESTAPAAGEAYATWSPLGPGE